MVCKLKRPPREEMSHGEEIVKSKRPAGRVMHEFKHGELERGPGGKGGKVKSRRQAIAIAPQRGGRFEIQRAKARTSATSPRRSARKRTGKTGQQEREGKSHVGARGERESTRAMGGKNATKRTAPGKKAAATRPAAGAARPADTLRPGYGSTWSRTLKRRVTDESPSHWRQCFSTISPVPAFLP